VVACLLTGIVGIPLYIFAVDLAGQLTGGVFIAAIGILLILTGIVQIASESVSMGGRETPTLFDSILVGAVQGLAILPGISRSGMTSSALLFRSYDPPAAFRLSFLLSIPASIGAAALTLASAGGLPGISPTMSLAVLLPFSFGMSLEHAMLFLIAVEAKRGSGFGRCSRYGSGSCPEIHARASDGEACRYWDAPAARFAGFLEIGERPQPGAERPACDRHYQLARSLLVGRALAQRRGLQFHLWLFVPRAAWPRLQRNWQDFADRLRDSDQWRRLRVLAWEDLVELSA
jgi:hypothetical protein